MKAHLKKDRDTIAEARRNWERNGWPDAAPGMEMVTSVIRVADLLRQRVETVLVPFGITFSRYELLALLMFTRTGSLPMSKASARLQVPPASVTHMVTRMEKDGLVVRRPDPADGRGTLVGITDQGIALVSAATPELNKLFTDLGVPDESRDLMLGLCRDFRAVAGETVER